MNIHFGGSTERYIQNSCTLPDEILEEIRHTLPLLLRHSKKPAEVTVTDLIFTGLSSWFKK